MTMLGDVLGSLESMSQLQLLLAFIACIGYAFAQGSLLPPKGRRTAWSAAAIAAAGFAFESTDWTFATVLLGFAVAGMGSFVALVWLTSRALGFGRAPLPLEPDSTFADSAFGTAEPSGPRARSSRSGEHAHSL